MLLVPRCWSHRRWQHREPRHAAWIGTMCRRRAISSGTRASASGVGRTARRSTVGNPYWVAKASVSDRASSRPCSTRMVPNCRPDSICRLSAPDSCSGSTRFSASSRSPRRGRAPGEIIGVTWATPTAGSGALSCFLAHLLMGDASWGHRRITIVQRLGPSVLRHAILNGAEIVKKSLKVRCELPIRTRFT